MGVTANQDRVVVARIGAAHGVRGEVRVKPFTAEPLAIRDYRTLLAEDGRRFEVETARPAAGSSPDMLVVRFRGIATREAAEALNGLDLAVPRSQLAEPDEDEFYHADLMGLDAQLEDGTRLGTVIAVQNFGAGDLLEIAPPAGPTILVPFTRSVVPAVDLVEKRVTVVPPPGLLDGDEGTDAEGEAP